MGIVSIRLNRKEESILNYLIDHYDKDKSSIIKDIIVEKYEDLQDLKTIKTFEQQEKAGKISFFSADDILNEV